MDQWDVSIKLQLALYIKENISQISNQYVYFLLLNYLFGFSIYTQILFLCAYIIKHFLLQGEWWPTYVYRLLLTKASWLILKDI